MRDWVLSFTAATVIVIGPLYAGHLIAPWLRSLPPLTTIITENPLVTGVLVLVVIGTLIAGKLSDDGS